MERCRCVKTERNGDAPAKKEKVGPTRPTRSRFETKVFAKFRRHFTSKEGCVSTLPLSSTRALGVGLSPALFVARELSLPSLHRI